VNINHIKINIGNNVMHLFLYVDYLTPCLWSDNIASVVLQGRQHPKKRSLCMYSQFSIYICTVTLPLTTGWEGNVWAPEFLYSWSTCNKLWWIFPLKTITKILVIYFLSSFTCISRWLLYVCTGVHPKLLVPENYLINYSASGFLDVT